jgi:hypothetical protein
MLHMPCQMQEMNKGNLYICYKGAPTHPTQEIKHTPSSPRKRVKVAWSRSLVKISASWSCVGTWIKAIFPFSTLSLRNDTSLLCAWFWNGALGSLQRLWHWCYCRMDLPGPTTSVGTRTDYSVGPWDYLMAWSTRTTEEKYSDRKLYMSRTVWKTPRRTRLVLSPYSDL